MASDDGDNLVWHRVLDVDELPEGRVKSVTAGALAHDGPAMTDSGSPLDRREDVRWFTRQGLREAVEVGDVILPSRVSISYRLVDDWLSGDVV